MKNKFALVSGVVLLVLTIAFGIVFGTTLGAALSMETGIIGLLVYLIPVILIIHGLFSGRVIPIILILLQLFFYFNNFIFGFVRF